MFVSCDNCLDGLEELLLPKLLAGLVGFQHMAWNEKKTDCFCKIFPEHLICGSVVLSTCALDAVTNELVPSEYL